MTLHELSARALGKMAEARDMVRPLNDYGAPSGLCEEFDDLVMDTEIFLQMICRRARKLVFRTEKHVPQENPGND